MSELNGKISTSGELRATINPNTRLKGLVSVGGVLIDTTFDKRGLKGETGDKGDPGDTGNGIESIEKTSTSGLVDTYTITYTDGTEDTFEVTNGQDGADGQDGQDGQDGFSPVASVSKVGDTATITITDENGTTTASVADGADGQDGSDGQDGADGYSPSASVSKVGHTATITITDKDGTTTAEVHDGSGGGASAFVAEYGVTTYADIKDAYDEDAIIICTVDDSGNTVICQLAYYDDANGIFYFAQPQSDGFYLAIIGSDDTWDDSYFTFASTDTATQLRDGLMSALDWQKLDGIASGAEVNVQSDWNQSTNTADDYIKNKPTIPSKTSDLNNDSGFITSPNVVYCTCGSGTSTVAKVATIVSGSLDTLKTGDQAIVKFTYANSATNPTLQIGTTAAKNIKRYGSSAPGTSSSSSWNANSCILFIYDGTDWQMVGWLNSTYSEISKTNITSGTASTTGLITGRRAKAAVEAFAPVKSVNGSTGAVTITVPTNVSDLENDAGYITGYTETDPVFTASDAYGITSSDITNWDNSYDGKVSLDTSAASGTDHDLYAAIVALGWQNDVIE